MVNEFDVENPDKEELKIIYNDENRYNWTFENLGGYVDYVDRYRMHAIIREVEKIRPANVLDDGCGSGVISRELAKRGFRVVGTDISQALLQRIPKTRNLELFSADTDALPFRDSTFRCVICSEVLEHLPDFGPAVREIRRVMDGEEAVVLITVPNWGCYDCLEGNYGIVSKTLRIVNRVLGLFKRPPMYPYGVDMHFHKMFPWQWKKRLESNGLEIISDRAIYLSPYIPKIRFVERIVYMVPGLFGLKTWVDDLLSPIWPFKYLGLSHLFICRKKTR